MNPTLAIVGAVNHGKSSVAATLAEDDRIGISDFPGETTTCQRFECRALFTLWDTPGFQDPRGMLREVGDAARGAAEPLAVFRDFSARHLIDHDFDAERELLRPLLDGAAILYVVDTFRAFERVHEAEMELLRLTGRPRLAVLNPTAAPVHAAEWRARLGQHFGAVHEFNAHRASARDRAELLRAMAAVADQWRSPLREAAAAIEAEWNGKLREAAQVMIELLDESLTHAVAGFLPPHRLAEKSAVIEGMKQRFREDLARIENAAHRKLIDLSRHSRVDVRPDGAALFEEELFSAETWSVLGLPWWVLAGIGAAGGGALGAKGGAVVGAHGELAAPSGIPTAVGASVGGVGGALTGGIAAVMLGKNVAQPQVRSAAGGSSEHGWFRTIARNAAARFSRTGTEITIGPLCGGNFPYILLDRATGLFCYLQSRTHARRDAASLETAKLKDVLDRAQASTASWSGELRDACKRFVRGLRQTKRPLESKARFRELLTSHLGTTSGRVFDPRNDQS